MNNATRTNRNRFIIGTLVISITIITLFLSSGYAEAKPKYLVPQRPHQQTGFLSVPYFGAEPIYSYFDHEYPNYGINNRIVLYDGASVPSSNGLCGWNLQGQAVAYYRYSGSQGECIWYDGHSGYDFPLDYEPILAAANGTIVYSGWQDWNDRSAGLGLYMKISHNNGYETLYGHMSSLAHLTDANPNVSRSQIIGSSGDTGNSSGPHLHFEVRLNGNPTDPFGGSGHQWLWQDGSWSSGLWVGQTEPQYGVVYYVDDDNPPSDDDPNFTKGRDGFPGLECPPNNCPYWYRNTNTGWNNDMLSTYITNSTDPDYWAEWKSPQTGLFDVQVWIPSHNATTSEARYSLIHSFNYQPSKHMIVDQWGTSNKWLSLGVHNFNYYPYGQWIGVWISDEYENGNQDKQLGIDAIRFRLPSASVVYLPISLKNYP